MAETLETGRTRDRIQTESDRALDLARRAHRDQVDRFGRDFIEHPVAVAELALPFTGERGIVLAYLHDTVEKGGVEPEEIEWLFGPETRRMVEVLGQDPSIEDGTARREDHRRRIAAAGSLEQTIYVNDRRESILALTALLEGGRRPEDFDTARRVSLWEGDVEAVDPEKIDPALLSAIRRELDRLSARLD